MKTDHSNIKRAYLLFAVIYLTAQFSPAQWVQQNSNTSENIVDVVVLDSINALAIGDRNGILRTTDAGTTWTNQSAAISAPYWWNGISFSGPLNGTIVGDQRIMTTTDGGFTWVNRSVPSTRKCLSVMQTGYASIYVGADSGWIYHTIDTGKTWTGKNISQWPIRSIFAWNSVIEEFLIFALTPFSLCEWGSYPPSSWKESILKNFEGLESEAFKGTICGYGTSFIVGVQGDLRAAPAIIRRMGADTVWTGVSQGVLHDGTFYGISAPSINNIFVCGDGGMLYKSTNGGDSWNSFTGLTTRRLKAISFCDVNNGFAVGDSGTILHTNNGGGIVVDVGKAPGPAPKEFLLDQNYPNPFNSTTVISYQLKVKSFTTVTVMDLLGREVAILVNEEKSAGSYSVRWNAANFPSGVYFYHLNTGSQRQVGTMSLVK